MLVQLYANSTCVLQMNHFPFGVAAVATARLDRAWVWSNPKTGGWQLVVAAKGKDAFSLPFRPGWQLVDEYHQAEEEYKREVVGGSKDLNSGTKVVAQLCQLCGCLHMGKLRYGVL